MKINFQEAAALLRKSDDILILCHRNPDGDTLGSGFGLYYALKQMGKQARVICNDPLPPKMRFFQSETVFEEFSPHFVMSVDIADEQLFGDMLAPFIGKVQLAIDHHPSNSMFAERTLLDANAAATCEIIYKLLKELSVTPDKQIADCLYTGIATDTGCFKFSNVTPETHRIAADLIEYGCDFQSINKRIFETKSLGLMELEKHVLNTLEFHSHNRIGIITVTRQMLLESGINEAELDGLSGIPRKVEGVEVGVTIKERGLNEYKLSIRTSTMLDASSFCQKFGGGGHARAAGCSLLGTLSAVKATLIQALEENLPPFLGQSF